MNNKKKVGLRFTIGGSLIGLGILHFVMGFAFPPFQEGSLEILRLGFFGVVGPHFEPMAFAFWYHVAGGCYALLGVLANAYERDAKKPLPRSFAWSLLVLSCFGVTIAPKSGFWAGIAIAFWSLWQTHARKNEMQS